MTKEVFDQLVEEIRAESLDTLVRKNKKYAAGEDKLHNNSELLEVSEND